MKFDIGVFYEILSRGLRFRYNLTRMSGALHEDLCIFITISPLILLRIRNMSSTICKENHNTFQVQKQFFFEKCAFYEIIWKSMVGHIRKYNAAQRRCYLHTGKLSQGYRYTPVIFNTYFFSMGKWSREGTSTLHVRTLPNLLLKYRD